MKNNILNIFAIVLGLLAFELVIILGTSLYWQHLAVVHHAAFFEASSWGNVSFHWNDVSYAQTPFQDPAIWQAKLDQVFQQKLKSLNLN